MRKVCIIFIVALVSSVGAHAGTSKEHSDKGAEHMNRGTTGGLVDAGKEGGHATDGHDKGKDGRAMDHDHGDD